MSGVPILVQTFVTGITSPNYAFPGYSAFVASLAFILTLQFVNKDDVVYPDYGENPKNLENLVFDFIIVGTGSCGATMAGRLSEICDWDILSIEAGETPPLTAEVVKLFTSSFRTKYDWTYFSEEKRACKAQVNEKCFQPRGRMIGGSTSINVMFYVRGSRVVYDRWENKHNCPGWGYSDVLQYFKKSERNLFDWNDPKYHSNCGQMCISFYDTSAPYTHFFEQAGNELGIPSIPDINAGNSGPGFVITQGTQCNGRRSSAAKSYIIPIKRQSNYRLIQKSIVTKLIFRGKRVIGVEFVREGVTYRAWARKEVILCGGSIGTPILLLLSGVGPKDLLIKNNIPVLSDSPNVGVDLADHVGAWLWYEYPYIQTTTTLPQLAQNILQYYGKPRTGIFAGIGTLVSVAFEPADLEDLHTDNNEEKIIIETYHYMFEKGSLDLPEVLRCTGYKNEVNQNILAANARGAVGLIIPTLLEPFSRGVVGLDGSKGVDAFIKAYIKFAYFSDPNNRDREVLIRAMQSQMKRETTQTFIKAGARLITMPFCFEHEYGSPEFCDCYIQNFGATIYHPVGTCKMGSDPSKSVVNVKGQVHGIEGVRIADASIMPEITWGNTNAPTIMIAEKLADEIKKDYGKPTVQPGVCLSKGKRACRCKSRSSNTGKGRSKSRSRSRSRGIKSVKINV